MLSLFLQILILSEEKKMFQQKLCEVIGIRDQAGHSLSCTEQSIEPLQTVSAALSLSFVQFVMLSGLKCWIIPHLFTHR